MSMITFYCDYCDNKDTSKVYEYDGCLGYEAIVCRVCGAYYDHQASYEANDWSKQFIIKNKEVKL